MWVCTMNSVNKTLYIPLYGKAFVSRKGLFLKDEKAEEIWETEGFSLRGKSKSKWLAYYMGMRAAVFDDWVKDKTAEIPDAAVLHIGCGMDSRVLRVGTTQCKWYDVDFPEVIAERKRYFAETEQYRMLAGDIREPVWLTDVHCKRCIVVMEGVSMYLTPEELRAFMQSLSDHFEEAVLLADFYSSFAAKMSKYKNPINEVGVSTVYGVDDPRLFEAGGWRFAKQHDMTPQRLIGELHGLEQTIFKRLYAGDFSKKLYKIFEYKKA